MKKFTMGFVLGLLLVGSVSYAYRIPKPQRITAFDENNLVILNETLENLWNVVNGRYNFDIKTSVPTSKPIEGTAVAYSSGGVYRLYIYLNGAWRSWASD